MVGIVVDDQSEDITYLCSVTAQTVLGTYFNNTWTTIASSQCGSGWFEHIFHGTGVQIVVSSSKVNQNYSVKIDDGPWIIQEGQGHFNSPALADGQHTVAYAAGIPELLPAFDYLIVTAGPSTPLQDRTLIVDDADTSLIYNGHWTTQPPERLQFDSSTALYQNTTHWSTAVGDTVRFQFTGSSVSVFGIFTNISADGNLSTTYTVDGVSSIRSIPKGNLEALPMAELFHTDLQAGNHTLLINVTQLSSPQAIGFDFITYNASFANLATMPGYVPPDPSSLGSSGAKKHEAGAIAGGVVGVLILLAAIALYFFWRRRRHSRYLLAGLRKSWSELKQ